MERGESSHPRVTTPARSRAFIPTSWGNLPRDVSKPQAKENIGRKEVGDLSPQSRQQNRAEENFDESPGKAHESPLAYKPSGKRHSSIGAICGESG
ncbi:hypothetical protein LIER_36900 [Lithospermum erythrorhizon]|uniref:Uncharacterized protein n=1 Tax=Lithospermum erythrorhizon TaxID=34254 RepID=A0AAV3PG54_LITER